MTARQNGVVKNMTIQQFIDKLKAVAGEYKWTVGYDGAIRARRDGMGGVFCPINAVVGRYGCDDAELQAMDLGLSDAQTRDILEAADDSEWSITRQAVKDLRLKMLDAVVLKEIPTWHD